MEDFQAKFDCVKLIRQSTNGGKTSAIDVAIQHASGDVVIIQDADLEYDPDEIPDIVAPILADVADVVYGSRFLVKRASRVLYFYHYLANKGLTFFSNILTNRNMSDIETCYKAFRKEVIKPIKLTSSGLEWRSKSQPWSARLEHEPTRSRYLITVEPTKRARKSVSGWYRRDLVYFLLQLNPPAHFARQTIHRNGQ